MDDLEFLEQAATADSTATLMALLPDSSVFHIRNVSPFTVLDKCPLLFHAFEFRADGDACQASVEATSRAAIIALLRFLYTGAYLPNEDGCLGSLLLHTEVFKIAEDFDVPELQVQAYVSFTRETEISCCSATPPSDLCATIDFLYRQMASHQLPQQQQSLIDTILNYCLAVFKYQALGEREDFRRTVFENPTFHQDLCRTSMARNFEDDGAVDIVQLPVCRPTPYSQQALLKRALGDFQFEIWQEAEETVPEDNDAEGCFRPAKKKRPSHEGFTLVRRPRNAGGVATFSESESDSDSSTDEHGFMLVHRPKRAPEIQTPSNSAPAVSDASTASADSPPVYIKPKSREEHICFTSDDEWGLI